MAFIITPKAVLKKRYLNYILIKRLNVKKINSGKLINLKNIPMISIGHVY